MSNRAIRQAVITLIALVIFAFGIAGYASAGSVVAPRTNEDGDATAALPSILINEDEEKKGKIGENVTEEVEITEYAKRVDLGEEREEDFEEAFEELKKAVPDNMSARFFFYLDEGTYTGGLPYYLTIPMEDLGSFSKALVMMYIDGEWKSMDTVINPDRSITAHCTAWAPVAVLVG